MESEKRIVYFVKDIADILKLSNVFVYTLFRREDFPGMCIANRFCIRKDYFWEWLDLQDNSQRRLDDEKKC